MSNKIKKISQSAILIIAVITIPVTIFAINNIFEGWKTTTVNQNINVHGICRNVKQTGVNSYFVPTNTATEWSSFLSSKPSDVDALLCPTSGVWIERNGPFGPTTIAACGAYPGACTGPITLGAACTPYGTSCSVLSGDPKTSQCYITYYDCL